MGSITTMYLSNRLRNYTIISTLRFMKNYLCLSSSNKKIYLRSQFNSQQRCIHNISPYIYGKVESAKQFSTTSILAKSKDRGKEKKKQKTQHIDFSEMEEIIDVEKLTAQLEKSMEILRGNFIKYLSVRSSMGAIEELSVKFDGKDYTLQELAQISRKPKLIVLNISTFPQAIPDILKSIMKNQMKLNPQQDGTTIYIPIPKVTREHRETLSKNAKNFYVKCCDNIRDTRNKHIKILKQKEGLAKDLTFRIEGYIDNLSREYMTKAENILEMKQKELLGDSE